MVITFESSVSGRSSAQPVQMTPDAIKCTQGWAQDNIGSGGGTNFEDAIQTALGILKGDSNRNCQNIILFLTDGTASFSNYAAVREAAASNRCGRGAV